MGLCLFTACASSEEDLAVVSSTMAASAAVERPEIPTKLEKVVGESILAREAALIMQHGTVASRSCACRCYAPTEYRCNKPRSTSIPRAFLS